MSNTKEKVKEEVKVEAKNITPVKTEGEFKIKSAKKMKNLGEKSTPKITKLDLTQAQEVTKTKEKNAVQKQETNAGNVHVKEQKDQSGVQQVVKEVRSTVENVTEEQEVDSPIQLISDEETNINESGVAGSTEAAASLSEQKEIPQETETQKLPENIDKLIKFMEETGGSIEDYSRLNADYSAIDDKALLHEYYKKARPSLDHEERNFIIEDSFAFDEELDEARDIRKKKLAYKEEVAKAKGFLEDVKSKYYDEIKLRPGVTQDQQKATDFFNRYNEDQDANKVKHDAFLQRTNNLLNDEFKGFDFKLGDKKFRYGVKDPAKVADQQGDISNFIKTFLNEKGEINDAKGYHKALYAARNADTIAQHFYEQGKTDAIKDTMAKSKNISTEPRKVASGEVFVNGLRVKSISGLDSTKLKISKKTFN
jgi:3-methyladenine DNA glycosylase Tag